MHHLTLVAVGSLKTTWVKEGCAAFLERIAHDSSIEVIEIPASKEKDPLRQSKEESQKILERLTKLNGVVWVLDERGKTVTSKSFSEEISVLTDRGESIIFVIGGAYGLTDVVRKAGSVLKLSDMTLPHELCRVVFLEQLYRAIEIGRGSGYHH